MEEDLEETSLRHRSAASRHHHQRRRAKKPPPPTTNYDDVFGGPPRHAVPFSGVPDDYAEVFGGVTASCSIPFLDLPTGQMDGWDCASGESVNGVDYGEIFGRCDFAESAVPYEELFGRGRRDEGDIDMHFVSSNGRSSVKGRSGPQTIDPSVFIQEFSNEDTIPYLEDGNFSVASDEIPEYNTSYSKSSRTQAKELLHTTASVPQPQTGFTFVVEPDKPLPGTLPLVNEDTATHENSMKPNPGSAVNSQSISREEPTSCEVPSMGVSDINLHTQSANLPPLARPAPPKVLINERQKINTFPKNDSVSNFSIEAEQPLLSQQEKPKPFLKSDSLPLNFDFVPSLKLDKREKPKLKKPIAFSKCDSLPPGFGSELDAMKEAMEFAQARLKTAKELHEQRREGKITELPLKKRHVREECLEGSEGQKPRVLRSVSLVSNFNRGREFMKVQGGETIATHGGHELEKSGKWISDEQFHELTSIVRTMERENKVGITGIEPLMEANRQSVQINGRPSTEVGLNENLNADTKDTENIEVVGKIKFAEDLIGTLEILNGSQESTIDKVPAIIPDNLKLEKGGGEDKTEALTEDANGIHNMEEIENTGEVEAEAGYGKGCQMKVWTEAEEEDIKRNEVELELRRENLQISEEETIRERMRGELEKEGQREKEIKEEEEKERVLKLEEEKRRALKLEEEKEMARKLEEEKERRLQMEKEREEKEKVEKERIMAEEKERLDRERKKLEEESEREQLVKEWEEKQMMLAEERERERKLEEERQEERMREKEMVRKLEEEKERERKLEEEIEKERERVRKLEEEREQERQRVRKLEEEKEREREMARKLEEEKERERKLEEEIKEERERVRQLEEEREQERERVRKLEEERELERERFRKLEEEREQERERVRKLEEERERARIEKEMERKERERIEKEREQKERERIENEREKKLEEEKEKQRMMEKEKEERETLRRMEKEREEKEMAMRLETEMRRIERERAEERERMTKLQGERTKERKTEARKSDEEREREKRMKERERRTEGRKSDEEREKAQGRKSDEERERERERRARKEREMERERGREKEEREREREKDRLAMEQATKERAERIALERITAARLRAVESREKEEINSRGGAEGFEKMRVKGEEDKKDREVERNAREARMRVERAAVERATAEARERAIEKAKAEAEKGRDRLERFKSLNRISPQDHPQEGHFKRTQSDSALSQGDGESALRHKARLERQQRTAERAAKALAEKNRRDIMAQREQAERDRIADHLDAEVKRWSSGKEGNLRALLSTLQYILGQNSGWQPIHLTEVITAAGVKKAYRKATLYVHPDKLQQRGASIQQKYICEKVFDLLKEAWNKFNSEER